LGAIGALLITILIVVAPHRINRIQSWWSSVQDGILFFLPSWADQYLRVKDFPEPYQVGHSLNAIANGGLSGTGVGEGFLKLGFLSEVHTDFVLAGIAEEAGFFGLFLIVSLLMLVVWRIFKISARVTDPIYHLFSLGIGLMIAIAFLINSFGISGIFPIKGIAVPFLSYGGSALLAISVCIGLVLSISKEVKNDKK
jgi:cell division protein FtsW